MTAIMIPVVTSRIEGLDPVKHGLITASSLCRSARCCTAGLMIAKSTGDRSPELSSIFFVNIYTIYNDFRLCLHLYYALCSGVSTRTVVTFISHIE